MLHYAAAGGRLSTRPLPRRLVIDVREFMSSLPSVLHQQGLQIVPVTLEVSSRVDLVCFDVVGKHRSCNISTYYMLPQV